MTIGSPIQSLWMLLAMAFYTGTAVCIKLASAEFSFYEIIMYRNLCGVIVTFLTMRAAHVAVTTRHPMLHLVRGLTGNFNAYLGVGAISLLTLSAARTLGYTSSLFMAAAAVITALAARRRPDWLLVAAAFFGFAGVLTILRPDFGDTQFWGGVFGVSNGFLEVVIALLIHRLSDLGEPGPRIIFYHTACGVVMGVAIGLVFGFTPLTWGAVPALLGLSLTHICGQFAMTRAWAKGNLLLSSILQYFGIIFAVIAGLLIFGDRLDALTVAGIVMVMVSGLGSALVRSKDKWMAK